MTITIGLYMSFTLKINPLQHFIPRYNRMPPVNYACFGVGMTAAVVSVAAGWHAHR
jgi:hypothetical protein